MVSYLLDVVGSCGFLVLCADVYCLGGDKGALMGGFFHSCVSGDDFVVEVDDPSQSNSFFKGSEQGGRQGWLVRVVVWAFQNSEHVFSVAVVELDVEWGHGCPVQEQVDSGPLW